MDVFHRAAAAKNTVTASFGNEGGPICIEPLDLFLLLALGVSLIAVLARNLGMLLGICRVFFALRVVAFPMMFGRGAVGFGSVLVMFSCFIVLVSSH